MTTLNDAYAAQQTEPLHTNDQIRQRAEELVGPALRNQLWVFFLDADAVQLPILLPVERMPVRATKDSCGRLATGFAHIAGELLATSVILVRERPGSPVPTARDREWAEHLAAAFSDVGLPIRALLLSSDEGVDALDAAA